MAEHGSNSLAVRFFKTDDPVPANKTQEMPAHTPRVGSVMPGGKGKTGKPAKGSMKTLRNPWRKGRHKKVVHSLMGY